MITLPIYFLVIGGVIILWLVFKVFEYRSKVAKPERVYVDTSGITTNPPKFIETLQNKTINFSIGSHKVSVSQLSIGDGLTTVNKIAALFKTLAKQVERTPKSRLDQMNINVLKTTTYKQIVYHIYLLSKPFVTSRRKFKKELFREAEKNHEKVLLIVEQIFDYWMYIKELLSLLARGGTLRMTTGDNFTWNSRETDINGNHIIKPRFALSTN